MSQESMEFTDLPKEMGHKSVEGEDLSKEVFVKKNLDRLCLSCRTKLFGLKTKTGHEISGYGPGSRFVFSCPSCKRNVLLSKTTTGWEYSENELKSMETEDLSKEDFMKKNLDRMCLSCRAKLLGLKTGQEISGVGPGCRFISFCSSCRRTVHLSKTTTEWEYSEKEFISVESEDLSEEHKLDQCVPIFTAEFFGFKTLTGQEISEKELKSVESEDLSKRYGPGCRFISFSLSCRRNVLLSKTTTEWEYSETSQESVEFKNLTNVHFPEDFTVQKFDRSCPMFTTKVIGSKPITGKEISGFVQLGCLMKSSHGIEEKTILSKLRDFAAGKDATVWIFNNLAVYFGLPISECLPDCVVAQLFVLGKRNRPPFILTLYQDNTNHAVDNLPYQQIPSIYDEFPSKKTSPDTATNSKPQDKKLAIETKTKVRSFTVKVAKELFTLLINFCSCEFVILPCTLSYEDFLHNQSSLENELKDQLCHTHSFYNGPEVLDSNTYNVLSQAVRVVQGMSSIPYQLKDTTKEDSLVVLDSAWQEAMQQAIVHLMSSCKQWHCTKEDEFKVMAAVLEAARRISFSFKVEVTTSNEDVIRCLSSVKELTKKETGIALNLEVVPVKNDCEYDFLGKQRGICLYRKGKKVLLICTDKAVTNETRQ